LQLIPLSLKLGAACLSKISVSMYGTTECKTPENYGLKNLQLEDLKTYITVNKIFSPTHALFYTILYSLLSYVKTS
jgi:hypothetical protein